MARRSVAWLTSLVTAASILSGCSFGTQTDGALSNQAVTTQTTAGSQSAVVSSEATKPPATSSTAPATPTGSQAAAKPDGAIPSIPVSMRIAGDCTGIMRTTTTFNATAQVGQSSVQTDGSLSVPEDVSKVAWWKDGALPGSSVGKSSFDGHVDSSEQGIGFLFYLRCLKKGDPVDVTTQAGQVLHYKVNLVTPDMEFAKPIGQFRAEHFMDVNSSSPGLTLITCGGVFNHSIGSYTDNVVRQATLESVSSA